MSSKEPLLNQQPAKDFSGFSKQARQLGLTLEKQIGTLSKLTFKREAANPLGTSSPDNFLEARNLRQNIGTKLAEFKNLVERMEDILTEYGNDLSDPTLPHTFRRHSEQLSQFQQEFSKIEAKLNAASAREELLGEESARPSRKNNRERLTEQSEAAYFMGEQSRIDSSHSMIDSTLSQAYEIRGELGQQGLSLASSNSRIMQLASSIPGMNGLLSRINMRRRRDSVVVGSVISLGIIFLFFTVL
ncbi:protein transport protein gos1 [Entomophthora muscae]|uniref:Protein transport protein gos1 n=1 Tax=Entomophthora muscae TaxID=34485 RepID=A0ACC2UJI0_9FUNG|nr:protein transport protein gos1 [Entomophthora muscae]